VSVFVDNTGKLGTNLVDADGNKMATPQVMLNESRKQQKRIASRGNGERAGRANPKSERATGGEQTCARKCSRTDRKNGSVCQMTEVSLKKRSPLAASAFLATSDTTNYTSC
jgi:hypothetical protein